MKPTPRGKRGLPVHPPTNLPFALNKGGWLAVALCIAALFTCCSPHSLTFEFVPCPIHGWLGACAPFCP